ncbi:MAG TPA: hypothetical protein VG963_11255 [Polyangiaceae bacterium]|nr:hypothetical protein [Polyangiaceae bacterium]
MREERERGRPPQATRPDPEAPQDASSRKEERWLIAILLLCGAVPWIGYLALGHWDERELGIATLILVFTVRGLVRGRKRGPPRRRRIASRVVGERHGHRLPDRATRIFRRDLGLREAL